MEVIRQLLAERAVKKSLARIRLNFCWSGLCLRRGRKFDPKDWDAKRERAKAKPGTYLDGINDVIDCYADAATAAEHDTIVAVYRHESRSRAPLR